MCLFGRAFHQFWTLNLLEAMPSKSISALSKNWTTVHLLFQSFYAQMTPQYGWRRFFKLNFHLPHFFLCEHDSQTISLCTVDSNKKEPKLRKFRERQRKTINQNDQGVNLVYYVSKRGKNSNPKSACWAHSKKRRREKKVQCTEYFYFCSTLVFNQKF